MIDQLVAPGRPPGAPSYVFLDFWTLWGSEIIFGNRTGIGVLATFSSKTMLSLMFWYDSYWQWSSGIIFPEIVPELQCQYDFCGLPRRAVFWVPGAGWMLRGVPRGRILIHFHRVSKNPPRNRRYLGNSTLKASPERVLLNPQALRGLASKTNVSLARRISRLPGTFGACKVRCFLALWGLLSARCWCAACGFFQILR